MKFVSKADTTDILWNLKVCVNSAHCTACWTAVCVARGFGSYSSANIYVKIKVWYCSSNLIGTCDKTIKLLVNNKYMPCPQLTQIFCTLRLLNHD